MCKGCLTELSREVGELELGWYADCLCPSCRSQCWPKRQIIQCNGFKVISLYRYEGLFRTLWLQYKEYYDQDLWDVFLTPCRYWFKTISFRRTVVCPPSAQKDIERRGFRHCEALLEDMGYRPEICFAKQNGMQQKYQNRQERTRAKQDIRCISKPRTQRILLFDDILTTGSTLSTCYSILHKQNHDIKAIVLSNPLNSTE